MKKRKFEILSVELSPGGSGPTRMFRCICRFIKNKKWVEKALWSVGRNEDEARRHLEKLYGGKN